jgi:hypothetical protein
MERLIQQKIQSALTKGDSQGRITLSRLSRKPVCFSPEGDCEELVTGMPLPSQKSQDNPWGYPIPLTVRLQGNQINYRSAIALSLAGKQSSLAPKIAQQLTPVLQQEIDPDFAQIQLLPPAWIELTLTERAVRQWLQSSLKYFPPAPPASSASGKTVSFSQYVRDRCWRILQLGVTENLVSLPKNPQAWEEISLPQFNHLSREDWQFIYQLIASSDRLPKVSSPQQLQKLAHSLGEAFLEFHRCCQFFDRKQAHFPQIAMIRFHLIAMTHGFLLIPFRSIDATHRSI